MAGMIAGWHGRAVQDNEANLIEEHGKNLKRLRLIGRRSVSDYSRQSERRDTTNT